MGTIPTPVADALTDLDTSEPIQCESVWEYDVVTQTGKRCENPSDLRVLWNCVAGHAITEYSCADCYVMTLSAGFCESAMCSTCDLYTWIVIAEPIR